MKSLASSPSLQVSLIKKGDTCPYDGALMPIETLRQLETKVLNADLYKTELDSHAGEVPLYSAPDSSKFVIIGIVALLLGYLVGMTVR